MLAQTAAMLLLTMEKYLLMDSVVVDLDGPEQAYLPKSLEGTTGFDALLLEDFLDVVQKTPWVVQKEIPKDNCTMYGHRSKAYGDRRIYYSKSLHKASVSEVVETLYLKNRLQDGWSSEWMASKMLEYGGKDKYVLWYQSRPMLGGMLPPRDFVSYTVRIGCGSQLASAVRKRRDLSWRQATNTRGPAMSNQIEPVISDRVGQTGAGTDREDQDCRRMGPIVILYTNASHLNVDHPRSEGVARGGLGTSGYYIQGISSDPPVTFLGMLVNADFKPPAVVPDILQNRFFLAKGMSILNKFKTYLGRVQSARKS